ncbi:MAG: nucleoside recognition domain-containing protein [Desulfuromonadales bacterium]
MESSAPAIPERLRTGLFSGLQTSWKLIRFVVPIYIAVDLLKHTPVIDVLGGWFSPLMRLFGLPGEAAFAFIAAFLLNLYAALAVLAPLDLTPWQLTQCGLMMGIAHNLLLEGAVLGSTGTRGGLLSGCRLAIAGGAGLLLEAAHRLGGF